MCFASLDFAVDEYWRITGTSVDSPGPPPYHCEVMGDKKRRKQFLIAIAHHLSPITMKIYGFASLQLEALGENSVDQFA
jgi:hypothetical protein